MVEEVSSCNLPAPMLGRPSMSIANVTPGLKHCLTIPLGAAQFRRQGLPTTNEARGEYMCGLADEVAFPGNADCGHGVVSCDHPAGQMSTTKGLYGGSCSRLQPILEDDET